MSRCSREFGNGLKIHAVIEARPTGDVSGPDPPVEYFDLIIRSSWASTDISSHHA